MGKLHPEEKQRLIDDLKEKLKEKELSVTPEVVKKVTEKHLEILEKFTKNLNESGYIDNPDVPVIDIDKGATDAEDAA